MWREADADPPRCPGSGRPAEPATTLADGFPDGRALCAVCLGFVPLVHAHLVEHDAWRGADAPTESARRREWFNAHGW